MSRPMRARGLKLEKISYSMIDIYVAPHAGAWIETIFIGTLLAPSIVAPHAGAWIETR